MSGKAFSIAPEQIPEDAPGGSVTRRDGGCTVYYAGNLMQWKLEPDRSTGFCSVVEVVMRRGEEPPLHVHAYEDELYYVLEGELTFYLGREVFEVGPATRCSCRAGSRTRSRCRRRRESGGCCS